jgi:phage terminase large subunit-like protein
LIRTATTNGMVLMTFTPLEGMTATVMQFLPDEVMRALSVEVN